MASHEVSKRLVAATAYGDFKLLLEKKTLFDRDAVKGTLICMPKKPLDCQIMKADLYCQMKTSKYGVLLPKLRLYEAERTLCADVVLQPEPNGPGSAYAFDMQFDLDDELPNTMHCELYEDDLRLSINWLLEVKCFTSDKSKPIILTQTLFNKGAVYVPQEELRPRFCITRRFLLDRFNSKANPDSGLTAQASLSKNVYAHGEPIVVRVALDNDSPTVKVTRVTACVRQRLTNSVEGDLQRGLSKAVKAKSRVLAQCSTDIHSSDQTQMVTLSMLPSCKCNCRSNSRPHRLLPKCAGVCHVPLLAGADRTHRDAGECPLAPTTRVSDRLAGLMLLEYIVELTIHVDKGRAVRFEVPFVLTSLHMEQLRGAVDEYCQMVSAVPRTVLDPPAYNELRQKSKTLSKEASPKRKLLTALTGRKAPKDELPSYGECFSV